MILVTHYTILVYVERDLLSDMPSVIPSYTYPIVPRNGISSLRVPTHTA